MWQTFEKCRETENVNCTFASSGPCQNPNHWPIDKNGKKEDHRISGIKILKK